MALMTDVTALSSRGQIVLPKPIRDALSLFPGSKLMVFSDGDNILLKPIKQPDISEFTKLMDDAKAWAEDVGMTEDDITDAVKAVRSMKRGDRVLSNAVG